jgi:asparagine synthase (glutamine-hydrolysing)
MCGIVGKFNFRSLDPVNAETLISMRDTLAHRGPDDAGLYVEGPIGLGHRRLSIIDLSSQGHQPMSACNGRLWVTFNGEIYNFQALQKDLVEKGYRFRSNCDTEVILYLYQEYGTDCLKYLRGMFAFAIWDQSLSTLFLARDRIGKKPLFYYFDGNSIIFASEMKAILQDPLVRKEINYEAFADYFKYLYIPDPKTIYRNIYKLEPGHFLTCSRKGLSKTQYWDISFAAKTAANATEWSDNLLGVLSESVRLRMISDVPLGAFLSGGIDSSGIVALMSRHQEAPVTTCSIGFDDQDCDEIRFARQVAERFKTDHFEFTVKGNAEDILDDLAYYFDEPFADQSAVPTYYVSKLARQKVKVALSGDGGDENFAGYEKYFLDDVENRIRRRIPRCIRRPFFPALSRALSVSSLGVMRRGSTLLRSLSHEADYGYYLTNSEFEDTRWQAMLTDALARKIGDYDPFSVTKYYYHRADTDDHLSRILYTDLKTYLPGDILVKVDRMSMAHSLEVRAPILDHRVIEFAAGIPPGFKYNRGEKKYILKRALRGILPEEILTRKKQGFSAPLSDWLRGELKDLAQRRLLASDSNLTQFFKPAPILKMWNEHQAGRRNHATILWSLLMFEHWFRRFMS